MSPYAGADMTTVQSTESKWVNTLEGTGRVFWYKSEFAIKFMHIAILVNKKELNVSKPGLGHLGKALDVFVLLLVISNRSFQVHSHCSYILFSPES